MADGVPDEADVNELLSHLGNYARTTTVSAATEFARVVLLSIENEIPLKNLLYGISATIEERQPRNDKNKRAADLIQQAARLLQ